jgi:hypothetical protein
MDELEFETMMSSLKNVRVYLKDGVSTDREVGEKLADMENFINKNIDINKFQDISLLSLLRTFPELKEGMKITQEEVASYHHYMKYKESELQKTNTKIISFDCDQKSDKNEVFRIISNMRFQPDEQEESTKNYLEIMANVEIERIKKYTKDDDEFRKILSNHPFKYSAYKSERNTFEIMSLKLIRTFLEPKGEK